MDGEEVRLRLLFGRFLEKAGLVTGDQVRQAMRLKNDLCPSVAETAVVTGVLTVEQLQQVRAYQKENAALFEEAVRALELLDDEQLETLRRQTRAESVPVGRILVLLGALDEDQLEEQIEAFHDYNAELQAAQTFPRKGARSG